MFVSATRQFSFRRRCVAAEVSNRSATTNYARSRDCPSGFWPDPGRSSEIRPKPGQTTNDKGTRDKDKAAEVIAGDVAIRSLAEEVIYMVTAEHIRHPEAWWPRGEWFLSWSDQTPGAERRTWYVTVTFDG